MAELQQVKLPDGSTRRLGNIIPPPNTRLKYAWKVYGTTNECPMVDQSKWDKLIDEQQEQYPGLEAPFLSYVHDQDGIGQCNADATASAMESTTLKQGYPAVDLSAADLYDRINGGADNGSMLEDGLAESFKGLTTKDEGGVLWRRGYKPVNPQGRSRFAVGEAFLCPTFAQCMSAVLMGFDIISGVMWYDNYDPEEDGWLPSKGRGGGGGHAVHGYKGMRKGSLYGIGHKNSWSPKWGVNGLCVFPQSMYKGPVGGWWAVRSMALHGGIVVPPPLAL